MAFVLADRVQETSTSPGGTGTLTLSGSPVPGFKTFSAGIGTGNTFYYTIYDPVTYEWEVGNGSWSANVLTRTTVLSNSLNTTAFISFTNGNTLYVWVDYPASKALYLDTAGNAFIPNLGATTTSSGAFTTLSSTSDATISGLTVGKGGGAGALNTALGNSVFAANTTGTGTGVGYGSLASNTTGTLNTSVGRYSLYNNISGINNSSLGDQSLFYNYSGGSNVAFGYLALLNNTVASNLTAIGVSALQNNTTNVATLGTVTGGSAYTNGTYTGVVMTRSSGSTALTYPTATIVVAGGAVTTVTITSAGVGFKDTTTVLTAPAASIGGTGSGFTVPVASLQSGNFNTAIGYQTLTANTIGGYNTSVGYQALTANTTGTTNTAVGFASLTSNTTASSNTAVGSGTLQLTTTGSNNTAIGYNSLVTNTTGSANTAVGLGTLQTNTTGIQNTATGYAALAGNTSGNLNVANGLGALQGNTTGSSNTAVGYQAGNTLTTGSNNTLIGNGAAPTAITVSNEITLGDTNITSFRIPGLSITAGASALTIGSQFAVTNTASAVNYVNATGAATGAAPTISAQGSDANIALNLSGKGSGFVNTGASIISTTAGVIIGSSNNYIYQSSANTLQFRVGTNPSYFGFVDNSGAMGISSGNPILFTGSGGTTFRISNSVASSVNYVQVDSAITGAAPVISAQGSDANITLAINSKGTGYVALGGTTSANSAVRVSPTVSSVNFLELAGGATGFAPSLIANGADTNIGLAFTSKGVSRISFQGFVFGQTVFDAQPVASAVNFLRMTAAVTTGAPEVSAQGSDTNIDLLLRAKGTGVVALGGTTVANSSLVANPTASSANYVQVTGGAGTTWPSISSLGTAVTSGFFFNAKSAGYSFAVNGATNASISYTASAVNYLQLAAAVTTGAPELSSQGSDTNINLKLTPKGTGVLQFGTYTAGIVAQAGYITITDAGGTSRRLLVG
jgi:hypothetical protein